MRTIDEVTLKIKSEDRSYANLCIGIVIGYALISVLYLYMIYREIVTGGDIIEIIKAVSLLLAMLNFMIFFLYYNKKYRYADYSEPLLVMLKKARKRYKPFNPDSLFILPALILADFGLSFERGLSISFWAGQLLFFGLITLSAFVGYVIWIYKYKPLVVNISELIDELESGR